MVRTEYAWLPNQLASEKEFPSKQVYGFAFNDNQEICIVKDVHEDFFSLPGGGIEEGETPKDALIREFIEEAQFEPQRIVLLGTVTIAIYDDENTLIKKEQQVRYMAKVPNLIQSFVPQKNGFETVERKFIKFTEITDHITWLTYPVGQQILDHIQHEL
jgi:8-oxo-dGTP pyrophosphatase MutT (NUDIX family)